MIYSTRRTRHPQPRRAIVSGLCRYAMIGGAAGWKGSTPLGSTRIVNAWEVTESLSNPDLGGLIPPTFATYASGIPAPVALRSWQESAAISEGHPGYPRSETLGRVIWAELDLSHIYVRAAGDGRSQSHPRRPRGNTCPELADQRAISGIARQVSGQARAPFLVEFLVGPLGGRAIGLDQCGRSI